LLDAVTAGVTEAAFWTMTPRQVMTAIRGYNRRLGHLRNVAGFVAYSFHAAMGGKANPRAFMVEVD
jgi:hypothetical protein